MPVTAKLSRRFYERLGDEIANELVDWMNAVDATYRADLRETNELNFTRFMASVDQRFAELEVRLEKRFAESDAKIASFRTELLKWMFIYWSGTMLTLAAFIFAIMERK
jgi:hypothetical protein